MILKNRFRSGSAEIMVANDIPFPSDNAGMPIALITKCPEAASTPILDLPDMANEFGIGSLTVKDESNRMGLGSFKALGAAYVIAHDAVQTGLSDLSKALKEKTYVTASAGNHGLSVAAGARLFGAKAIIYLPNTVPAAFASRLEKMGAEVRHKGTNYKESMAAARATAEESSAVLLSDSSWEGYTELPHRLMQGYLVMAAELVTQVDLAPTHIALQAGVGGMAAAVAAYCRKIWGDEIVITLVEPDAAPAIIESVRAGHFVETKGPDSIMGRLDCKEPSLIALKGLARDADYFVTVSDEIANEAVSKLDNAGIATSPSGAGGIAALLDEEIRNAIGLNDKSRFLAIISEGPE